MSTDRPKAARGAEADARTDEQIAERIETLTEKTALSRQEAEVVVLRTELGKDALCKRLGMSDGQFDSIRYGRVPEKLSEARRTVDELLGEFSTKYAYRATPDPKAHSLVGCAGPPPVGDTSTDCPVDVETATRNPEFPHFLTLTLNQHRNSGVQGENKSEAHFCSVECLVRFVDERLSDDWASELLFRSHVDGTPREATPDDASYAADAISNDERWRADHLKRLDERSNDTKPEGVGHYEVIVHGEDVGESFDYPDVSRNEAVQRAMSDFVGDAKEIDVTRHTDLEPNDDRGSELIERNGRFYIREGDTDDEADDHVDTGEEDVAEESEAEATIFGNEPEYFHGEGHGVVSAHDGEADEWTVRLESATDDVGCTYTAFADSEMAALTAATESFNHPIDRVQRVEREGPNPRRVPDRDE